MIISINRYYDMKPFKIDKRLKCVRESDNDYDEDAIKVVLKHIDTIGYVANQMISRALG